MTEPAASDRSSAPGDFERLLRAIIERSVKYRAAAVLIALVIVFLGVWSAARLRLDVTPDISNVQVQVLTPVPDLSPEEIETSVTRPIELEMFGLPGLEQIRSLTRFGVSQVCLVLLTAPIYIGRGRWFPSGWFTPAQTAARTRPGPGSAQFRPGRGVHLCARFQTR